MNEIIYSVVVPLYNEELVINESYRRLVKVMDKIEESYEILFINDGSTDCTKTLAEHICNADGRIKLINFSRNFGHQAAITAGMRYASGNAIIIIDADLQDPPETILDMIKKWKEGFDVVYGKRAKREGESLFKKFTAKVYYRLLKSMTKEDIPVDTGDFRLISRKVCDTLNSLPEKNRYVRGLVSWVGYKQTFVQFDRQERFAGETKYPLNKMIKLAFDGIAAFSTKPMEISGTLGMILLAIGTLSFIFIFVSNVISGSDVININLLLAFNLMMFGIVFCFLGIMGQYIGRIFVESKDRPLFIVDSTTNYDKRL